MDTKITARINSLRTSPIFVVVSGIITIVFLGLAIVVSTNFFLLMGVMFAITVLGFKKFRDDNSYANFLLSNFETSPEKVLESLNQKIKGLQNKVDSNLAKAERSRGKAAADEYDDAERYKRRMERVKELKRMIQQRHGITE